ncbi:hypothetical protein B0H12DRAFT_1141799, partial [Mycena haematopus]
MDSSRDPNHSSPLTQTRPIPPTRRPSSVQSHVQLFPPRFPPPPSYRRVEGTPSFSAYFTRVAYESASALEYVDIMYLPTDGKLVCRVCLLGATSPALAPGQSKRSLPARRGTPRTHCEELHPEACQDVVGLGQPGVQELRRRLGLANCAPSTTVYEYEGPLPTLPYV